MNTKKRGRKKNDVASRVADIWNEKVNQLIEERCGSRKAFVEAYRERYGVGNVVDARRWVNVNCKAAKDEIIGFPSYDTMRRIADFFDVTVGYLTGETDYKTFELERACKYLGIDQAAGEAILRITKMKDATRFEKYQKDNYGNALCRLLAADGFEEFIGGICQCAEAIYCEANPVDYMNSSQIQSIKPEILEQAIRYKDVWMEPDEEDDAIEMTDELRDAIYAIRAAEDKGYHQQFVLDQNVKVAKYELQERYFHLIEEILRLENCKEIQAHYYAPLLSIEELKRQIDATVK